MTKSLIFTLSLFHTDKSEGKHDFSIIEIIVPYIDCIYINTMFAIATLFKIGIKSNKSFFFLVFIKCLTFSQSGKVF